MTRAESLLLSRLDKRITDAKVDHFNGLCGPDRVAEAVAVRKEIAEWIERREDQRMLPRG